MLDAYEPEFMKDENSEIKVPALAFAARNGRLGWEELSFSLLLAGSPLVSEYLGDPPEEFVCLQEKNGRYQEWSGAVCEATASGWCVPVLRLNRAKSKRRGVDGIGVNLCSKPDMPITFAAVSSANRVQACCHKLYEIRRKAGYEDCYSWPLNSAWSALAG